jgi:uncharacterized peroxidase-related enzyme
VVHHGAGLRTLLSLSGRTTVEARDLVRTLSRDYREAALSAADRAMLDYAVKLTMRPASITREDVDRIRSAGFDDRALHDICAVTAYYAFVNRIADGLGVELEPRFDPPAPSGAADDASAP